MLVALLFSVSYSGSWGQETLGLEQFIERAAELGFEGVMLGANGRTCRCSTGGRANGRGCGSKSKGAGAPRLRRRLHQLHGGPGTRRDSAARISNPLRDGAGGVRARPGRRPGTSVHRLRESGGGVRASMEAGGGNAEGMRAASGGVRRDHRRAKPPRPGHGVAEPVRFDRRGGRGELQGGVRRVGAGAARRGLARSTPGFSPDPKFSLANSPVSPLDRLRLLTAPSNAASRSQPCIQLAAVDTLSFAGWPCR